MSEKDLRSRIRRRLEHAGATLNYAQAQQLSAYFGLLAKWNRQLNLTSLLLEPPSDDAVDRLLIEPVVAARVVSGADGYLIDLGSGGGSPAIPLRIAAPQIRLLMVESHGRKSAFLRDAVRQLGLRNSEVANTRFEDLLTRPDREPADLVSVRAVKPDETLWTAAQQFLRPGGRVLWLTSASATQPVTDPGLEFESVLTLIPATPARLAILRRTA